MIDTHEGGMVLHVYHSWVDCHQDEPLLEWQRVKPVAVREAIHRLSIFSPVKSIPERINRRSGHTPDRVKTKARPMEGGLGEREE